MRGSFKRRELTERELRGMLSEERDAWTVLQEILIQSAIEERESQAWFLDRFEELAGYYKVLGW